jgi:hypothetical protein
MAPSPAMGSGILLTVAIQSSVPLSGRRGYSKQRTAKDTLISTGFFA